MNQPTLRLLSLGAGVQSTVLALMAAEGTITGVDGAIFADTGWEPKHVYQQVERLSAALAEAGIPLHVSSRGNLKADTINPDKRFVSVPWFIRNPDGSRGMARRQCTKEYKLGVVMRKTRELLGAEPPNFRRVPRGRVAEQLIGFSTEEIHRVNDKRENLYTTKRYPLLEFDMSRTDCERWLRARGWGHTAKSACIGCPFHGNAHWRDMRDNRPDEWAEAVEWDRAIRKGGARGEPLRGEAFLHNSRVPLDQAPIDRVSAHEWASRQLNIVDAIADQELDDYLEHGEPGGCGPFGCRSGPPISLEIAPLSRRTEAVLSQKAPDSAVSEASNRAG